MQNCSTQEITNSLQDHIRTISECSTKMGPLAASASIVLMHYNACTSLTSCFGFYAVLQHCWRVTVHASSTESTPRCASCERRCCCADVHCARTVRHCARTVSPRNRSCASMLGVPLPPPGGRIRCLPRCVCSCSISGNQADNALITAALPYPPIYA